MRLVAVIPWLLALPACLELAPRPQPARRALGSGDAAPLDLLAVDRTRDIELSCTRVPPVGCCSGETLWWCEQGHPQSKSCVNAPHCGWSNSGFFDCNTSGAQDPTGQHARDCTFVISDARSDGATSCGAVTSVGCCEGNVLKYCDSGALRVLPCTLNPSCGWQANGRFYDCGTPGQPDPQGAAPMACPPPHLDAKLEGPADWGGDTTRWPELGGDVAPKDGCSCDLPARSGGDGALALLMALVAAATACRRRRR